jgi:hypothetical protein
VNVRGLMPMCWRMVSVGVAAPPGKGLRGGAVAGLAPAGKIGPPGRGRGGCTKAEGANGGPGGRMMGLSPTFGATAAGTTGSTGARGGTAELAGTTGLGGTGVSAGLDSASFAAILGSAGVAATSAGGATGFGASATGPALGFASAASVLASATGSAFAGFFLTFFPEKWSLMS